MKLAIDKSIMEQHRKERQRMIASFDTCTIASLANWTQDQFNSNYRINDKVALKFAISVMVEFHQDFQMPADITWEDLQRDWEFDEIFNETFVDVQECEDQ